MSGREDFISGNGEIVQFLKGGREEGLGREWQKQGLGRLRRLSGPLKVREW